MNNEQLSLQLTTANFARVGIKCEVPYRIDPEMLPSNWQDDPDAAVAQFEARYLPGVRAANSIQQKRNAEYVAGLGYMALATDNPAQFFQNGLDRAGIPQGEAVEALQADAYEQHPKLRPFLVHLQTPKQKCGQVRGNSECRKILEEEQMQLQIESGEAVPSRSVAAALDDFTGLTETAPTPALAGQDLEARVRMVCEKAGLEIGGNAERRFSGCVKPFGEQAIPDVTVITGIADASGRFLNGFNIECKNRTAENPRIPDLDLFYSMHAMMNYALPTILVLESKSDQIWKYVEHFKRHYGKRKGGMGNLLAVLTFGQAQQWLIKRAGGEG